MFTDANDYTFIKIIDELILYSTDSRIRDGIDKIEKESNYSGKTIYQIVFELMEKDFAEGKAKHWIKDIR